MDPKSQKLRIKIGSAEFEAEGSEESVQQQYQLFLEVLAKTGGSVEVPSKRQGPEAAQKPQSVEGQSSHTEEQRIETLLDRAFSRQKDIISLRVLPSSKSKNADALLLLLFGYQKLKGEHDVYGTQLMKAARQSGLPIDRIDRVISEHKDYFIRGGARRGARYALNNRGERKAQSILSDMFK